MTSLLDSFSDLLRDPLGSDPMSRTDRARWASTASLADVAHLTAQWLTGDITNQPGYCGRVDIDHAPHLLDALVALNTAGILTTSSQGAHDGPGYGGSHWRQYAYVTGIAHTTDHLRLREFAEATHLRYLADQAGRRWVRYPTWTVTTRDDIPVTDVGVIRPRRDLADPWTGYGICGRTAVEEICDGWQFAIVDPHPSRDTLWPLLATHLTEEAHP